ncbi:MAG TPA: hypothetical protein VKT49_01160 [Bryobacteraceae bacterium]|nr:hypothetical protein [Bryobacteraceae bacterium]
MTALLLFLAAVPALAQLPDVRDIMQKVASNQAKTQDARAQFLYHEKQSVRLHRTNGKLMREEFREYNVTPTPRGIHRELIAMQGRYLSKAGYVIYDEHQHEADGIDAGLVEGFSEDFHDERNSRDGIDDDLFPLTYHQQLKYEFRLIDKETDRGRSVYRIAFDPKERYGWRVKR